MRSRLIASILLAAGAACAAELAAVPDFPAAFTSMARLSLAQEPFYASELLNDFSRHVDAVAAMKRPADVKNYLETVAAGGTPERKALSRLKRELEGSSIPADRASALLLANALARPDQFRATLKGLEDLRPGFGRRAASILADAKGTGYPALLRALRAAGADAPTPDDVIYGRGGTLEALFDGRGPGVYDDDAPVGAGSYAPTSHPSGLSPSPRK